MYLAQGRAATLTTAATADVIVLALACVDPSTWNWILQSQDDLGCGESSRNPQSTL